MNRQEGAEMGPWRPAAEDDQDCQSGKAGEGGARCRHEPRIEAGDCKRRSRQ